MHRIKTLWNSLWATVKTPDKAKILTVDEKILRGNQAEFLLRNDLWKEAIEDVKRGYIQALLGTSVEEVERREYAYLMVNAVDDVNKRLHTWLTEGKLESDRLKKLREAKMRQGRYPND